MTYLNDMSFLRAMSKEFSEIKVGDFSEFSLVVDSAAIDTFATLTGDRNLLHTDVSYAVTHGFRDRVVHGHLILGYVSRIAGMHLPGERSLVLKTEASFMHPVFVDDSITITGTVASKQEIGNLITVVFSVSTRHLIAVKGTLVIQVRK